MKSVLISIRPEWCAKIASGEKTLEVRKNRPKLETPFKCYIYCTKSAGRFATPNADGKPVESAGKVIAEFVCDRIDRVYIPYSHKELLDEKYIRESCVSYSDLMDTFLGDYACFWHISDLKLYDKPKEIWKFHRKEFYGLCGTEVCGNERCEYYERPANCLVEPPTCAIDGCFSQKAPQSWYYVYE